jgi:hypothetical protein
MNEEESVLSIMDETGDRRYTWKKIKDWVKKRPIEEQKEFHQELTSIVTEPEDIKKARLEFETKMSSGRYDAYSLYPSKKKITEFDPDALFIIMSQKLAPGKYD